jgi:hypothetical protein
MVAMTTCKRAATLALGTTGILTLNSAFVPTGLGRSELSQPSGVPLVGAPRVEQQSWTQIGVVGGCLATVGTAMVSTLSGKKLRSTTKCSAVRRELAAAYEDSGIDLMDNGKFAQGLVGAEGMTEGLYEFDPLGFSSEYTYLVPYFREAELKHGRIAMLAWVGMVAPDFVRIPGERYSFEAVPVSIQAHEAFSSATGVNFQILFWIGIVEFCCAKKVFEWNSLEVAGDYGLTGLFPKDEEGQKRMRLAELKNGRLAMLAFAGAVTQAALTQNPFPWFYS